VNQNLPNCRWYFTKYPSAGLYLKQQGLMFEKKSTMLFQSNIYSLSSYFGFYQHLKKYLALKLVIVPLSTPTVFACLLFAQCIYQSLFAWCLAAYLNCYSRNGPSNYILFQNTKMSPLQYNHIISKFVTWVFPLVNKDFSNNKFKVQAPEVYTYATNWTKLINALGITDKQGHLLKSNQTTWS